MTMIANVASNPSEAVGLPGDEPSRMRTLTPQELDEVNGGVAPLVAGAFLALCFAAGLYVGFDPCPMHGC